MPCALQGEFVDDKSLFRKFKQSEEKSALEFASNFKLPTNPQRMVLKESPLHFASLLQHKYYWLVSKVPWAARTPDGNEQKSTHTPTHTHTPTPHPHTTHTYTYQRFRAGEVCLLTEQEDILRLSTYGVMSMPYDRDPVGFGRKDARYIYAHNIYIYTHTI